jgi:hypothetical protein
MTEDEKPLIEFVNEIDGRNAMPWDLLFPGTHYVPEEVFNERFSICEGCEFFSKRSPRICKKCLCWMKKKATIAIAYCPERKWGPYSGEMVTKKEFDSREEDIRFFKMEELAMEEARRVKAEYERELQGEIGAPTPEEYNP